MIAPRAEVEAGGCLRDEEPQVPTQREAEAGPQGGARPKCIALKLPLSTSSRRITGLPHRPDL